MDESQLQRMLPKIVAYFRRSCGDNAEDIASAVLQRILPIIQSGQDVKPAFVWQAAHWARASYYKQAQRRLDREVLVESVDGLGQSGAHRDTYDIDTDEDLQILLQPLTTKQRSVIEPMVRGSGEIELKDVATSLEISLDAARRRMLDGQKKLRWVRDGSPRVRQVVPAIYPEPKRPIDDIRAVGHQLGLTRREYEVLLLLRAGSSITNIAVELKISTYTAKNHIVHLYRKTGVMSAIQIVTRSFEMQMELQGTTAAQ